jgi:hypothetical protein
MPVSSPVFKPIVNIGAQNITISEVTTVLGKATISLPDLTKSITLRARTACILKLSDTLGGQYITILPKCVLVLEGLEITGKILYIESNVSVVVIETLITHG